VGVIVMLPVTTAIRSEARTVASTTALGAKPRAEDTASCLVAVPGDATMAEFGHSTSRPQRYAAPACPGFCPYYAQHTET
jgi:hypothetical protein